MDPVRLTLAPRASNVRIARLVAAEVCRVSGLDEPLVDDVRLAAGEACGRAVAAQVDHGVTDHVEVDIEASAALVSVSVRDHAPGGADETTRLRHENLPEEGGDLDEALALPDAIALLAALSDELEIRTSTAGADVRMQWRAPGEGVQHRR